MASRTRTRETVDASVWSTKDLPLVGMLCCEGFDYLRLELGDGPTGEKVCWWVFADDEELQASIDDYHAGDALVEPQQFHNKCIHIKNEMFRFMRSNNIDTSRRR